MPGPDGASLRVPRRPEPKLRTSTNSVTAVSDNAEENVAAFYANKGWAVNHGVTEDARRWEDLREHAAEYVSLCRQRTMKFIPPGGENILDMASGPIQYPEYLEFSKNFAKRYCVDLSAPALELAKARIGDHGVFMQGSFFEMAFADDFFDCSISLHTIYHMDQDRQEEAVRKLVRITKRGHPVIIVYSNPDTLFSRAKRALRFGGGQTAVGADIYFHAHPIDWWRRFGDVASVSLHPWRAFAANMQRRLIPDNALGRRMLRSVYKLEERFPAFFVRHFQYPMIVLTKK
jgi:ubiquinone/menaquinone biosynthesis C-methylase UbiE